MTTNQAHGRSPLSTLPAATTRFGEASVPLATLTGLLADVCDVLATALIIVDRGRRIVHTNAAGLDLLMRGQHLRRHADVFAAPLCGPAALLRALAEINDESRCGGMATAPRGRTVMLGDDIHGAKAAFVRGIGPLVEHAGHHEYVHFLIAVPASRHLRPDDGRMFGQLYGLTEMELRVLYALANGQSPKEAARSLAIRATTLTTHLKHIFDKTGARRQAQVVALYMRGLSPLEPE